MNFSSIWIRRPIMTFLVMFSLFFFGAISYSGLGVDYLPNVDFPTIQISASLPGASPETMASTVAVPLERQFSTISGIQSMTSQSIQGLTQISIQFDLKRNIDAAALDVNSAISVALKQLPRDMPNPPSYKKVNPADIPVLYLSLTSDSVPMQKVDEYTENLISPTLAMIEGVSEIELYGSQKFAVRIQVNPSLLAAKGIGIDEVAEAIKLANVNLPQGILEGEYTNYLVDSNGQLANADAYQQLIVSYRDGDPVRIRDIGQAIDSVQNLKTESRRIDAQKSEQSISVGVKKQPGANAVEVVDRIRAQLPQIRKMIPEGIALEVTYDRTLFIRESFTDVQYTLLFTIMLVILVIFLFLRSLSSTIIPGVAVPLSLIATFSVMYLMGHTLNNISLMALTLSVGFVVDDAIVMLENIVRKMERGESPRDAAFSGSGEIGFTIVSMTLSLAVVFIPLLFMGGILGRLFREFSISITAAILLSGFISLTFTPMLCCALIKPSGEKEHGRFHRASEAVFERMRTIYGASLQSALQHRKTVLAVSICIFLATGYLFHSIPKGFLPLEDRNLLMVFLRADESVSFQDMARHQHRLNELVRKHPDIESVLSFVGTGNENTGRLVCILRERNKRNKSINEIIAELRPVLNSVPGVVAFPQNPPAIRIGAMSTDSLYQFTLQGINLEDLYAYGARIEEKARTIKGVTDVGSDMQIKSQKAYLDVDRDVASSYGITLGQIQNALYSAYGERQISTIYGATDEYYVILEVEPRWQGEPGALELLHLKSKEGGLIPLSAVSTIRETVGPLTVNHTGQLPSVTVSFNLIPGTSLDLVTSAIRKEADSILPDSIMSRFQGTAGAFQESFANMGFLLFVTVLVIYIVLGILYESLIHPVTILTSLPLAGFGALLALMLFGRELDLFAFVGLILLVGIVKKNGIMMIDFALEAERKEGRTTEESIYNACIVRFRPIMMTTMAALFGSLPLALGFGAGGDARQGMGIAVVGGLLFSQVFTLYITPVFYVYFDKLAGAIGKMRGKTRESTVKS